MSAAEPPTRNSESDSESLAASPSANCAATAGDGGTELSRGSDAEYDCGTNAAGGAHYEASHQQHRG